MPIAKGLSLVLICEEDFFVVVVVVVPFQQN